MDYARFVRLRRALWDEFEERLRRARVAPRSLAYAELEGLAHQYRQVLHDHALARARYRSTAAAERLRALALEGTHWLHPDAGETALTLRGFFSRRFPAAFRRHLPALAAATALFAAAAVLGFNLALSEPGVGVALLGPEAVEGLRRGRLWTESLSTTIPPAVSSSAIATNNMSVAITAWGGGALAGSGALYVVVLNGLLLGIVFAATSHYGLAGELFEFVSAHGPLEITLILTSAAGGLALGRALVAAEDRPRRVVTAEAGREAMVLLVGCLPWFLLLGVIEGVVSPSPAIPAGAKAALGLSVLATFLLAALRPPAR